MNPLLSVLRPSPAGANAEAARLGAFRLAFRLSAGRPRTALAKAHRGALRHGKIHRYSARSLVYK